MLCTFPSTSNVHYVMSLAPAAWYRYGVGITSSAGLVSQWDDQSGNDRHLVQATGTNQPSHESDGSILFDGVDNYMQVLFTLDVPHTIYCLFKAITFTTLDRVYSGGVAGRHECVQLTTSPNLIVYCGGGGPYATITDFTLDTYGIICTQVQDATGNMLIQRNNGTPQTGEDSGIGQDIAGFTLGAEPTPGNYGHIQVKEVVLYSAAHDADQRYRVVRYLAHVGGIAV